jgi:hypothetical protein
MVRVVLLHHQGRQSGYLPEVIHSLNALLLDERVPALKIGPESAGHNRTNGQHVSEMITWPDHRFFAKVPVRASIPIVIAGHVKHLKETSAQVGNDRSV